MKTSSKSKILTTTIKKQKFVGSKEFIDRDTGELVPMQVVEVEDRDFNFHKVWLQNFLMSLEGICNQRLRLAFWILDNLDSENKLVMTQQDIANKSGLGIATVKRTMNILQSGKPSFLQKMHSGAYRINPDVIWKGSFRKRLGICFDYRSKNEENAEGEEITITQAIEAAEAKGVAAVGRISAPQK